MRAAGSKTLAATVIMGVVMVMVAGAVGMVMVTGTGMVEPNVQEAQTAYILRKTPRNLWCVGKERMEFLKQMIGFRGPEGMWASQELYRLLSTPSCTVEQYKQLDESLWSQQ